MNRRSVLKSSGIRRACTGCSVLVYGVFGFLLSLFAASTLGISINPILLSEALPFLVITVGFEKPFILARAVFSNPALAPVNNSGGATSSLLRSRVPSRAHIYPSMTTSARVSAFGPYPEIQENGESINGNATEYASGGTGRSLRWGNPVPAKEIVIQGFDKTGKQIIRDYAIEIAVLIAGSLTGVQGLKEFCQLAALILCFDCLFLFGFFASVLTIMVEVSILVCISKALSSNIMLMYAFTSDMSAGPPNPRDAQLTKDRFICRFSAYPG